MERQRRVSHAGLAAVALAMALAGPALAAPGSADLVVQGPIQLDGRSALVAEGGYLLVRDPGNEAHEGVKFTVQGASATVIYHQLRQNCFQVTPQGLAQVESLPARLGLTRLDEAIGAASSTLDPALSRLATTRAGPGLPAVPIVDAAAAALLEPVTQPQLRAAPPVPSLPVPLGPVSCLNEPTHDASVVEVEDVLLSTLLSNPDYGALWHAADGEAGERGSALLQASEAEARFVRNDETVRFVAEADPWHTWDPVASEPLPGQSIRAETERGTGSLFGAGTLWLFNVKAMVVGVSSGNPAYNEEFDTGQEGSGDDRVLRFLEVQFRSASGSFNSPGRVFIHGPALSANLDGTLGLRGATGEARVGDKVFSFTNEATALTGQLSFLATPVDRDHDHEGAKAGAMVLRGQGEVSSIQGAGPFEEQQQQGTVTTAAAVLSVAAIGAGLAAWFWPALKWLVAPLYTRIPKDTLLMHDARERIYKLIREEPGIHAHEVAARLDLGWGTAVYHLKLLERNSLVVARHEGRYKRFFVTGDQRLQVKDAVALLRNPTSRNIATQVAKHPGLIQKQLCEALGLSPSLASWHLQRLEQAHVVHAERLGRAVRYIPGQAWVELQHLDAAIRGPPAAALPEPGPPAAPAPGAA